MASSQENVGGSRVPREQQPLQHRVRPILKASLTLLVNAVPLCSALVVPMAAPLGAMANGTGTDTAQKTPVDRSVSSVDDFRDLSPISPEHWAYEHLSQLVNVYKCVAGFPDGTFRGDEAATRSQMVALLKSCLDNLPTPDLADSSMDPVNLYMVNNIINLLAQENCSDPKNCPTPPPEPPSCSEENSEKSLEEDLQLSQKITTLVIRNNDALKSLEFSNLKNLTQLTIKNNHQLTRLTLSEFDKLHDLINITIDNNNKLEKIVSFKADEADEAEATDYNRGNIFDNIKSIFTRPANPELHFVIKHNNCLKDHIKFTNLNNLKELRIESNDNLTEIKLDGQQASNGQASTNPSASPPAFLFSRVLTN